MRWRAHAARTFLAGAVAAAVLACGGATGPEFAAQGAPGARPFGQASSPSNAESTNSNSPFFSQNNRNNSGTSNANSPATNENSRPATEAPAPPSKPVAEEERHATDATQTPQAQQKQTAKRPAPERASGSDLRRSVSDAKSHFDASVREAGIGAEFGAGASLAAGACDRLCDALRSLERSTDRLCSLDAPVPTETTNAGGCSEDRAVAARARAQVEARCGVALCPRSP